MENKALPSDFVFSQSSLQSFRKCPRQFELRYIRRLAWPAERYADSEKYELDLNAGLLLHQLIERYLLGIPPEVLSRIAEENHDSRLALWFLNFLKRYATLVGESNIWPEKSVIVTLGGHNLLAKFDLLCSKDGRLEIYDWKSSAKKPNKAMLERSLQSKVYLLVAANMSVNLEKLPLMRYWEANFPLGEVIVEASPEKLENSRKEICGLMNEIDTCTQFQQTNELERCRYCCFRSYCNRGSLAGETAEDESFEPNQITVRED